MALLRRSLLIAFIMGSAATALAEDPATPDWRAVSAIFKVRCIMCHSVHGAGLGLRLDSYDAAVAGSRKGPVLLPGDPAGSELVRRLRGASQPRMPFLGRPLAADEIDLIERWIAGGLPVTEGLVPFSPEMNAESLD